MAHLRWAEGLSVAGLYYDGVVDESKLQEVLQLHKRDTVITFGTRSSRRVARNESTSNTGKGSSITLAHSGPSEKENDDSINESTQEKPMVSIIHDHIIA